MASRHKVTFVDKKGKPTFLKKNSKRVSFPKARVPFYWLLVAFVFFAFSLLGIYEQGRTLDMMNSYLKIMNKNLDVTSVASLFVFTGFSAEVVVSNMWTAFTFLFLGLGFMALILQWKDFGRYKYMKEFDKIFEGDKK